MTFDFDDIKKMLKLAVLRSDSPRIVFLCLKLI